MKRSQTIKRHQTGVNPTISRKRGATIRRHMKRSPKKSPKRSPKRHSRTRPTPRVTSRKLNASAYAMEQAMRQRRPSSRTRRPKTKSQKMISEISRYVHKENMNVLGKDLFLLRMQEERINENHSLSNFDKQASLIDNYRLQKVLLDSILSKYNTLPKSKELSKKISSIKIRIRTLDKIIKLHSKMALKTNRF